MKVVLLPGLDGTGLLFQPLIEALSVDIDVVVISYPKFKKQSYEELIDFVIARLPEENYILVGESFSGNIAYNIAKTNPKHLMSVIFVVSFLSNPRPLLLEFINRLSSRLLFSVSPPKMIIKQFMLSFSTSKKMIQLFLEALKQTSPDVLSFRLKEISKLQNSFGVCKVNAIYIQATNDYLVPQQMVEEFKQSCINLSIKKINGPHFILQAKPEECARIIESEVKKQE